MTFLFEKERMTAVSPDGAPMGYIAFPRINSDLVNISHVSTDPQFRNQGVTDSMMEALLHHLTGLNQKAALTSPLAQEYVRKHSRWKHILPGELRFTTH